MDTLIFGLLLATGLVTVFSKRRWLVISTWGLAVVLVALLFNFHVTSALVWSL